VDEAVSTIFGEPNGGDPPLNYNDSLKRKKAETAKGSV